MKNIFSHNFLRFNKVVLWGYNERNHSHRYIHEAYYSYLTARGINCLWVDDDIKSNEFIQEDDLLIIPDVHLTQQGKTNIQHNFRNDVFYILHPGDFLTDEQLSAINPQKMIKLYEYRNSYKRRFPQAEELDSFIYIDHKSKSLLQPWGTDVDYRNFLLPTTPNLLNKEIYFVGSVWGDEDGLLRGNKKIIQNLSSTSTTFDLDLKILSGLSQQENIETIRASRISISPGSVGHISDNYLQCRTFKNISYGQPTITDVLAFQKILGNSFISFIDWPSAISQILDISTREYITQCTAQQESIKNYTYEKLLLNMISTF